MTQIKITGHMNVSDVSISDLDQTAQETKRDVREIFEESDLSLDSISFGSTDSWDHPRWIDATLTGSLKTDTGNPKEEEHRAKQSMMEIKQVLNSESRLTVTGTMLESY